MQTVARRFGWQAFEEFKSGVSVREDEPCLTVINITLWDDLLHVLALPLVQKKAIKAIVGKQENAVEAGEDLRRNVLGSERYQAGLTSLTLNLRGIESLIAIKTQRWRFNAVLINSIHNFLAIIVRYARGKVAFQDFQPLMTQSL